MIKMKSKKNCAGFTMVELVISVTMAAVVIFAISSIAIFTAEALSSSDIERELQIDVNNLTRQITDGVFDPGSTDKCGLRGARSYTVPNPQQVRFDNTDSPPITRSFIFSNNTLIYDSPTNIPPGQIVIYAPNVGAILDVEFRPTSSTSLVEMRISVTRMFHGKLLSGSVVTSVNLRNPL